MKTARTTTPHPLAIAAARQIDDSEAWAGDGSTSTEQRAEIIDRTCRVSERETDHAHALAEAKRRVPDYPWERNTMSEAVWVLGESMNGTGAACDYWRQLAGEREALCRRLVEILSLSGVNPDVRDDAAKLLARLDARGEGK